MHNNRQIKSKSGFALIELIVVMLIISIITVSAVAISSKQVARSKTQQATAYLQSLAADIETAVMDMGYLETSNMGASGTGSNPAASVAKQKTIKAYLNEMEDLYLSCGFDYSTSSFTGFYVNEQSSGFSINLTFAKDPWGMNYRMFYYYDEVNDSAKFVLASAGPDCLWASGAGLGYFVKDSKYINDDIVVYMIS